MKLISTIFAVIFLVGCGERVLSVQSPDCESPESYIAHVVDTLQTYSLLADSVDWKRLEAEAQASVAGATSIEETYRVVDRLLRQSGDRHAWFRRPAPEGSGGDSATSYQNPSAQMIDGRVGYLVVPAAMGRGPKGNQEYATALQNGIRRLDANVNGWIVDLRRNWGGNMWPMLAGLGPLLGDGVVGYFVYPDGVRVPWSYEKGKARLGDSSQANVDEAHELSNSTRPIAVLVGEGTTSSGEATAVAFRGLGHVENFGTSTSGLTTAIESKRLCDGSVVGISTAAFADRQDTVYRGPLLPDVLVEKSNSNDAVLEAAKSWIMSQTQDSSDD